MYVETRAYTNLLPSLGCVSGTVSRGNVEQSDQLIILSCVSVTVFFYIHSSDGRVAHVGIAHLRGTHQLLLACVDGQDDRALGTYSRWQSHFSFEYIQYLMDFRSSYQRNLSTELPIVLIACSFCFDDFDLPATIVGDSTERSREL